jgi:serine/threonine protein kinase
MAYLDFIAISDELYELFSQYFLHCWTHSALISGPSDVLKDVIRLLEKIALLAAVLSPSASTVFDPNSPKLTRFHIIDLLALIESFEHFLKHPPPASDSLIRQISNCVGSVRSYLTDFKDIDVFPSLPPGHTPSPIYCKDWRMARTDFTTDKELGSGVSATVYLGNVIKTGTPCAVKVMTFKKLIGGALRAFEREVVVLSTIEHPALLRFIGAVDTPPFCIVTEWMAGGSLYQALHRPDFLNGTDRTKIAIDVARGMHFLHSKLLVHRDLKSLNVLLTDKKQARVADFGTSRSVDDGTRMTGNVGTPHWMAPEVLNSTGMYDGKADVYSYAVMLWELVTSRIPYQGMEREEITANVAHGTLRPKIPAGVCPALRELMEAGWAQRPRDRPSFRQILNTFRAGKVMYQGADPEEVLAYIQEVFPPAEVDFRAAENLEDLHPLLSLEGIPPAEVAECWEYVHSLYERDIGQRDAYLKTVALFLRTSYDSEALKVLAEQPPGVVRLGGTLRQVLTAILPTGRERFDGERVHFACKNGAASIPAMQAVQAEHIKLGLEVIAIKGVANADTRAHLVPRCIQLLRSVDPMLIAATLRCLIRIDEVKGIPFDAMAGLLQSRNGTVRLLACVALGKVLQGGVVIPESLTQVVLDKVNVETMQIALLALACKAPESAALVARAVVNGWKPSPVVAVRVLGCAAKRDECKKLVASALAMVSEDGMSEDLANEFAALKERVQ